MSLEDTRLLKNISLISFASTLRGIFVITNFNPSGEVIHFIKILNSFGVNINIEGDVLTINSNGALHLFEPENAIDVKGSAISLFALASLFAPLDYTVFFIDSTNTLKNTQFHSLILGFYEVGIRFTYGKEFTLPISMKGTSNFLPMNHLITSQNPFLELAFFTLGMQGFGKTRVISSFKYGFEEILKALGVNCKIEEEGVLLSLHHQQFKQNIEIDFNKL
jgi:5-enolpyruvylshikimate-3-phosphate synthase